jgi:hypothetical protein
MFVVRGDNILDQPPLPSQLGATRTGGIELNRPRIRAALQAALSPRAPRLADRSARVVRSTRVGLVGRNESTRISKISTWSR